MKNNQPYNGLEIAVIGMACRLPGAKNWREYWKNLAGGIESIHRFSKKELEDLGLSEEEINQPNFINASAILENKNLFDASFFDYRPGEAQLMSPVHRVFHECVWEALEDAGYNPEQTRGLIGLYAGGAIDINWMVYTEFVNKVNPEVDEMSLSYINNKDYLSSLVSYKLNLKGPAISLNTACSTSLVALNSACKSLLLGETKIALAGGVSIKTSVQKGYLHQENMIHSSDGHCKAFDKDADGTVSGEGAGVVVLKRLSDAINDNDQIYAIIKGSAINNDGKRKVGFTAPSVEGQVECILKAQKFAKVQPDSISYVEAHGTGTKLGDPIEVEALNIAFNRSTEKHCALGSVKSNIGHLDSAAGIAGLIKTVLSLKHQQIPASLHYQEANPSIDFEGGPFYVNTKLADWKRTGDSPLRAGLSSFGVGGTNAHVILEEAPMVQQEGDEFSRKYKILTISAKTETALLRYMTELSDFLIAGPEVSQADLCYTLQVGRKDFTYRKSLVYQDQEELVQLLNSSLARQSFVKSRERGRSLVFMFSGVGSQYVNMGKDLYAQEAVFRAEMDKGFSELKRLNGLDYKGILYPEEEQESRINEMLHTQPMIFLFGYALARLFLSWGMSPKYLIGHSVGEYVAACISGVFSFEDGLKLVVKRGLLMNSLPAGGMLSVVMDESSAKTFLTPELTLAAINGPSQVVFSGDVTSIDSLQEKLEGLDISCIRLQASHAGHSVMMDSILAEYRKELESVQLESPKIPFISNLTGAFIKPEEAGSVDYWLRHIRETVQFSAGIKQVLQESEDLVFLEIGGGHSLSTIVRQHQTDQLKVVSLNSIRHFKENDNDEAQLAKCLGQLWSHGIVPDWSAYHTGARRKRISLPTYSFEPIAYPTEVNPFELFLKQNNYVHKRSAKVNDWFFRPQWKQSIRLPKDLPDLKDKTVVLFSDHPDLTSKIKDHFMEQHATCVTVSIGAGFEKRGLDIYAINPAVHDHYEMLFAALKADGLIPSNIVHLLNVDRNDSLVATSENINFYQKAGYESLLEIVRKFTSLFGSSPLQLDVVTNGWYSVTGNEMICPAKAPSLGAVKVIPSEFLNITCSAIDMVDYSEASLKSLFSELVCPSDNTEVAIRGKYRYLKGFEKISVELADRPVFRIKGTYLITGANGGMSSVFSNYLVDEFQSNLILTGRGEPRTDLIRTLEKKGAKVIYIQSDVTDFNTMTLEIEKAEQQLGSINGVIHTAGMGDYAGVILNRSHADDQKICAPKLWGTQVLVSIFRNKKLDFFVNCSSTSASLAPFGQVAYVASNLYQDAVAEADRFDFPVLSIEWTAMQEIGMAIHATRHLSSGDQTNALKTGISPKDAVQILAFAIGTRLPVQIISTSDFEQIFNERQHLKMEEMESGLGVPAQNRPDISTAFVAAETDTEKKLLYIYEKFFGITQIGIEDNFFELGGDSLKAMVLLKKISQELNANLTLKVFFEHPTIKKMALDIDEIKFLLEKKNTGQVKTIKI